MDSAEHFAWHDVLEDALPQWRALFDASTEGEDLSERCPVCGQGALHRWFESSPRIVTAGGIERPARGSQWQWCSECGSYEHTTSLVPSWWMAPRALKGVELRHDPGPIEAARRQATERNSE